MPGGVDTSPPVLFISTTDNNPLIGGTFITATITVGSKPVTGFTIADFTKVNCTLSNFVSVDVFTYTVRVSPTVAGAFSIQIPAGTCVDLRGTSNLASNILSMTYINTSSSDLENAAVISLSQHYRGHTASFTDCNDLLSSLSIQGMELIYSKYNTGVTMFATTDNASNEAMYQFGRCDFGIITLSTDAYAAINAAITTLRGSAPSVGSYKNGNDSYKADMVARTLYERNSNFEAVNQTLPTQYTGLSDVQMSSRGVTFRNDYYAKTTGTSYYRGIQSLGDSRLASYVSTILSTNGWYTNFVHWHWQVMNYPEYYQEQLALNLGAADVFKGSVNQVVEYYWAKEAVTSVSGLGSTLTVNHTKDYPGSPYSSIGTPVWIKIDTTGSNYAGNDIACSNGLRIRKISANVFYVPVLLDFTGSSTSVVVATTTSPNYVNLNQPVINRTGNSVTVDQSCKLTIFKVHKPTSLATSTTSVVIPTADNTTVNLTVATGLTIPVGATLRVSNDSTHYFYASVLSYTSGTGALSIASSGNLGTGTFASWTVETYFHLVTATIVERQLNQVTSYTILATLDNTNYTYYVAAINADGMSAVT